MNQPWRIVARQTGGPEVLEREDFDPGQPGPGEVLVRHEAIGLNFIDIYHRTGLYPMPLPLVLGSEAAGVVELVGEGVSGINAGDRVAYIGIGPGTYATHRRVPAERIIKLPDTIGSEDAAAVLLKGVTTAGLAECARTEAGQWALVHAAAGGVGSLLVPWLADLGVQVIAHAGTAEKAALAESAGAVQALHGPFDGLAAEVREITGGRGVDTVYDGVGAASWTASIAALKRRGLMISFGNASGPVPPVSLLELGRAGSLFATRFMMYDYMADEPSYRALVNEVMDRLARGVISANIHQRFALADAAEAHRALEGRRTTGATVLVP